MKSVAALTLALLAFGAQAHAKTTCDMAGMKSQIIPRIKKMLAGVYSIEGKTLDTSKISISPDKYGIYACTATRPAPDQPGYVFCDGNTTYESLDVSFISPSGTKLTVISGAEAQSLGFTFEVNTKRDEEGKPLASTCSVSSSIPDLITDMTVSIYNPAQKVVVSLTQNLGKSLPGEQSTLLDMLSFDAPMN
jgi:hypothetical protein